MDREYIIIPKTKQLPFNRTLINELDDSFWLDQVFHHILKFYKNHDSSELKNEITDESNKEYPKIENRIARYIRRYLRNNVEFEAIFDVNGESEANTEVEGYYDIKISNTFWKNKNYFPFECKNLILNSKKKHTNKYVYYKLNKNKYDGGAYRYFNGKYAQLQDFGGMLGFVLNDDLQDIKNKIIEKLKIKFDTSPSGDLIDKNGIEYDGISGNNFTFSSTHYRNGTKFKLFHILFPLN
ncbi:hypothetical protein [Winogradskyella luteola]|uniref:Uncharacterized protein n=1 Tax=Winogradskyella luteola TaxID=2828330 RepID=A0A9X1FB96_9FLAO|nr:hypothetical protein [Winogradskyella luteola]MBV7270675.1 hypothetical protein [Winogradskyella luteola]